MSRKALLPALLTLGNLFCGFAALAVMAQGKGGEWGHEILVAAWFVLLAMLFDMFDGKVARLTHQTSDFGGELDSLCDVVSFGVAPGLIIYLLCFRIMDLPVAISVIIAGSYTAATAIRLARFNVGNSHKENAHHFFQGLPSPAAAGVIASLVILNQHLVEKQKFMGRARFPDSAALEILPYVALLVALLMVSSVPFIHVTNILLKKRRPPVLVILGVVFLVCLVWQPEITLFCMFAGYLFSPLASPNHARALEQAALEEEEEDDEEAIV